MKKVIGLLVCIGLFAPVFSFGQEEGEDEGKGSNFSLTVEEPINSKYEDVKEWVSIDSDITISFLCEHYVIYNVIGKDKYGKESLLTSGKLPEEKKLIITQEDGEIEQYVLPDFFSGWLEGNGFVKAEVSDVGLEFDVINYTEDELNQEGIYKLPTVIPRSTNKYITESLQVKRTKIVHSVTGDCIEYGLGNPGDKVIITEFDANDRAIGDKEFTIVKEGLEYKLIDSFNLTPIFNFELGKKKANGDGSTGFSPGIGFSYLFFYKSAIHEKLANLGFGFNISYINTALYNNDTQEMKNTSIVTTGVVLAYKISDDLIFETVLGVNINGDDKFFQLGIGLGTLVLK